MTYKCDDFQACLNQVFVLTADDYRDELELVQVDQLDKQQTSEGQNAFSVIFQSTRQEPIPQQIYRLSNEQLGELQLFIVPIGQDDAGVRYEAVFS